MCVILSLTDHTSVAAATWASKYLIMTSLWRRQPWHACASASAYVRMCGKRVLCTYVIKTSYICLSLSPLALQDSLCMSYRRVSDLLIEFSLDWRREAWNTKHFHVYVQYVHPCPYLHCVYGFIYTVLFLHSLFPFSELLRWRGHVCSCFFCIQIEKHSLWGKHKIQEIT